MSVTVQPGDSMWAIAQRLGVSFTDLIGANPQVADPGLIYAGQELNVPGWDFVDAFEPAPAPASEPPSAAPATVAVQPGDSLWAIAARNGVSLDALIAANPQIANPSLIHAGDLLNLPGATAPAPVEEPWTPPAATGNAMVDVATAMMNNPADYANPNEAGDHTWDLWCLGFVNNVSAQANGHRDPALTKGSAREAYQAALFEGRIRTDFNNLSAGAAVFWPGGRYGHVAVCSGRTNDYGDPIMISSTGWNGRSGVQEIPMSVLTAELGQLGGWMVPQ